MKDRIFGSLLGAFAMFLFMVMLQNEGWMANAEYMSYTDHLRGTWHCWLEKDGLRSVK